ncbi:MAG: hypothetical protein HYX86_02880 [Chloroflexi bacterium]|nr:hypothetical protein [Chloroflexota bacterium]
MSLSLRSQIATIPIILSIALAGCLGPAGRSVDIVSPSSTPTLAASATPAPSPTPECWPLDRQFREIQQEAESLADPAAPAVECPQGRAITVFGAMQTFRHPIMEDTTDVLVNYMIWQEDIGIIYLVVKLDEETGLSEIYIYPDTWDEDQPAVHLDCQDMIPEQDSPPPEDQSKYLQVPIRGFGKVWCENQLWERIGFGVGWERGVEMTIQQGENGFYISVPPEGESEPLIFVLDTEKGSALAP